ncbi:DsbA family oxidoreductase [Arenicella xantha]|uniref:Putative DsbA family dithiol-disulfide isomerase n=1 Tax=Arenicella xantha TaxID=644221 RepID=A0A395JKH0_9GAMM|nr:DsbA family oxidoreductase [Arenicella xantha]RBP51283.1 putative DsbA family dithiol-disulfide isomerase [Arenicella xantha]
MHTIDIVSDVSCPWCIIGYRALKAALDELTLNEDVTIHWRPFELNPTMPPEGQDRAEHIQQKYGLSPAQTQANRQTLIERGESVGYQFNFPDTGRIYNTFDAHRLLHWAAEHSLQTELKLALFDLYFQQAGDPSKHAALLACVDAVGLPVTEAQRVLDSDQYVDQVRSDQALSQQQGISAVPAFIFDNKYLVSGGQPKEAFVEMLQTLQQAV